MSSFPLLLLLLLLHQAFTQYTHVRHLSTFLDVHAIMAFAAMAFGAVDPTERLFWRDKAESMMKSMREYVRTRAGTLQDRADGDGDNNSGSLAPLDDDRDKPRPLFEGRELPPETLELHSFPIQRYKNRRPAPPTLEWGGGESRGEGAGGEGGVPDNLWVAEHLGLPLCEALYSYRGVSSGRPVWRFGTSFRSCFSVCYPWFWAR